MPRDALTIDGARREIEADAGMPLRAALTRSAVDGRRPMRKAVECTHLGAVDRREWDHARAGRRTLEDRRARAALREAATELRALEREVAGA